MSSIKKQKYHLSKIKYREIKRLRDEGIVRLSVPEPKLSNVEILMTCVDESSSSFGKIADTKEEEAMQTSWFGFDQETMLRLVKVLIHKEKLKAVKSLSVNEIKHEDIDSVALTRYKVVKSKSAIWPCAVVAGNGEQELFSDSESTCKHVARKLAGAFLDGAFYANSIVAKPHHNEQHV